jgi:hypothetical protein
MILVDKFDYHGSYINGPSKYYSWIVPLIDRERFHPFLCSLRSAGRSDVIFRKEGVVVEYFGLHKYDPRTLQRIVQFVRRNEINLLHLTGYASTTFGRIAARICGRPAIVHEHWVDPGIGRGLRTLEWVLSPWTDRAIAISDTAKRFLVEKKHVRPSRIEVIQTFRWNSPTSRRLVEAGELGIPEFFVIGIGDVHENKDTEFFEAAFCGEIVSRFRVPVVGDRNSEN